MTSLQQTSRPVNSNAKKTDHLSCNSRGLSTRQAGGMSPKGRKISAAALPSLNSNNFPDTHFKDTSKTPSGTVSQSNLFTGYHRKQAFVLEENVKKFVQTFGLNNVGFLTLTFRDNVEDNKEASRRYKSLEHNFLAKEFGERLLVKERQKRGAWHYHLLVDCKKDIRTGFDFDAIKDRNYKSASPDLRVIWSRLRMGLRKYGFGRHELLPIKTNDEAISKYVGKYLSKHVNARTDQDKGVRLFSCSAGFAKSVTSMAWNSDGSKEWRRKVSKFADIVNVKNEIEIARRYGAKWAYHLQPLINAVDDLSPYAIPEMALNFTRNYQRELEQNGESPPWVPPPSVRRLKVIHGTLYRTTPRTYETGEMEELF